MTIDSTYPIVQAGVNAITAISVAGAVTKTTHRAFSGKKSRKGLRF